MNTQYIRRNNNALLLMSNNSIKDIPTTTAGNLLTPVPSSDRRETKKKFWSVEITLIYHWNRKNQGTLLLYMYIYVPTK